MAREYQIYGSMPEARAFEEGVQRVNDDSYYVESIYRTQGVVVVKLENEDSHEPASLQKEIAAFRYQQAQKRRRKPPLPG